MFLPDVTEAHVMVCKKNTTVYERGAVQNGGSEGESNENECNGAPSDNNNAKVWQFAEFGKNAQNPVQLWSSTKIVPLLALVVLLSKKFGKTAPTLKECSFQNRNNPQTRHSAWYLLSDMFDYGSGDEGSNATAALLKTIAGHDYLDEYLRTLLTFKIHESKDPNKSDSNNDLSFEFRGLYGVPPPYSWPELVRNQSGEVLLTAPWSAEDNLAKSGSNFVPVQAISPLLFKLGLHAELQQSQQIEFLSHGHAEELAELFQKDLGQEVFAGLSKKEFETLGGKAFVLSKIGFGWSDLRRRTELVIAAFVRFEKVPDRALAFTFRVSKSLESVGLPNLQERETAFVHATAEQQIEQWVRDFLI